MCTGDPCLHRVLGCLYAHIGSSRDRLGAEGCSACTRAGNPPWHPDSAIQHPKASPDPVCRSTQCWHHCPGAGSDSNLTSWLDGGSRANLAAAVTNTAVAGELLGVDIELHNPLAVGLSLTRMQLLYEHEGGAAGPASAFVEVSASQQVLLTQAGSAAVL